MSYWRWVDDELGLGDPATAFSCSGEVDQASSLRVDSSGEPDARLRLRLPARAAQAPLLRAELRLWLVRNQPADENAVVEILAAATEAFLDALTHPNSPRSIAVEVEASYADGGVDICVRDYAGRNGNTVELWRPMKPSRQDVVAARVKGR
jgi:Histidine kinase-like ATPase domain